MTTLDKVFQAILGSVISVILAVAILALLAFAARGQEFGDFGVGHHEFHGWYETGENGGPLMRPDARLRSTKQHSACVCEQAPARHCPDDLLFHSAQG
jgi:hypothetical protein